MRLETNGSGVVVLWYEPPAAQQSEESFLEVSGGLHWLIVMILSNFCCKERTFEGNVDGSSLVVTQVEAIEYHH